jgi:F0F1-type ATP synthase membrane subunit b/b'
MKTLGATKIAILMVLAIAGLALLAVPAPEGHPHGFDLRVHGLYIVAFLMTILPIIWFASPKLKQFLQERHDLLKAEIEEAKRNFEIAEQRLEAAKKRAENLTQEMNDIIAKFRALGEKERDALAHEGAVMSEKLRAEVQFAMEQALKVAKMELRNTIVDEALKVASTRLVETNVSSALVERFVKDLRSRMN